MKNILFFFSTTEVGGAETNIIKISRELFLRGYKIHWASLSNTGPMLEQVDFEIDYIHLGLFYPNFFAFKSKYIDYLVLNNISCVLNFGLRVEIVSRILSKKGGVRKIVSNIRSTDDWRRPYHTFLDRITMKNVDQWVSNSLAAKQVFQERERIPSAKIKVIYNFIELKEIESKSRLDNRVLKIGILANLTKEKGYFDLLDLSKKLKNHDIKHEFHCAGKDLTNGKFFEEVISENLDKNFKFYGFISDKFSFFNSIDIFILPSYLEGMPTALLEAVAHQIPVVSTNVGGIPEIITDGVSGYLCSPGDVGCMKESIMKLQNKDIKGQLVANSKKVLTKFSKEKIMDLWEQVVK